MSFQTLYNKLNLENVEFDNNKTTKENHCPQINLSKICLRRKITSPEVKNICMKTELLLLSVRNRKSLHEY